MEGNISDPAMFIYYNFDSGPGSPTIPNLGSVGNTADLINGKVFNGDLYYELVSKELRTPMPGYWVSLLFILYFIDILFRLFYDTFSFRSSFRS